MVELVIKIPESEIPKQQDIIDIPLHFIDGKICEAGGYEFDVLPDNATNGEVVENLFSEEDVELFRLFMTHKWWNAPYKKGENNE